MKPLLQILIFSPLLVSAFNASGKQEQDPDNLNFLTIGGGYSPSGNQVSLEKNVQYLNRMLIKENLGDAPHSVYFADGDSDGRDLQYLDPKFKIPKINEYLARFVGSTKGIQNQYRSHELDTDGASKSANIAKWFDTKGKILCNEKDKLLVYFTGHGGRGEKKKPHNTVMYLWQDKNLRVSEFVKELDKLPTEVPVTVVMVQCYSGGFANIIFNEGDANKGLTNHTRAGFCATLHTRLAAGCTPDINEANYREYSTYFWEALFGETRLGKKVKKPDYDGDGKTSYAEAHAYTILKSSTIDIPVKTSDAFLRHFSRTKNPEKGEKVEGLLTTETSYSTLLKKAGINEKTILEGLSRELKISGDNRGKAAREGSKKVEEAKKKLNTEKGKLTGERNKLKGTLAGVIKRDWPEVANAYHPATSSLLNDKAKYWKLVAQLESHKDFKQYMDLSRKIDGLSRKVHDEDRKWVKYQRFLRTLENVALEANMPKVVEDCTILDRYKNLLREESSTL
ncbi:MAG: hypothetical protein VXB01_07970 [Opitutae bacterium]